MSTAPRLQHNAMKIERLGFMIFRLAKILAILIVTVSAVVAVTYDLKLPNGDLSIWGKMVIALTTLSGITAVILEGWEHLSEKNKEKIEEATQKDRKKALDDIAKSVRSIDQPLLPVSVVLSLRIPIIDKDMADFSIYNFFTHEDFSKMVGMAPSDRKAFRMTFPEGYVDIENNLPIAAGSHSMDHHNMNAIHEQAKTRYILLDSRDLRTHGISIPFRDFVLLAPQSMKIVINTGGVDTQQLNIESKVDSAKTIKLAIFDEAMVVYFLIDTRLLKSSSDRNWGVSDLKGAQISFSLGYLIIEGMDGPSEEDIRQVRINDFKILCGDKQKWNFAFTSEMLSSQNWHEVEGVPLAKPTRLVNLTTTATISANDFEANSEFS